MQTLADEWRKRDKERELIFQRKTDEYNKLEEKMRAVCCFALFPYSSFIQKGCEKYVY